MFGAIHRRLHLGAGLDAGLVGQALLERRQHQACRDHASLALADHLEKVHLLERFGITHALCAAVAQFHRDRVEVFVFEQRFDRIHAAARDMRGTQQDVFHAIAVHVLDRLA